MHAILKHVSAGILATLLAGGAFAATKDEVVTKVNAAIAHIQKVGTAQAIKDINADATWKANSINVITQDMNGLVHASSLNEKLRGKNTRESKDPTGKEFVKEFIAVASKGEGWIDYQFIDPETKKIGERSMFVKRVPGFDGFVGAAITK